MYISDVAVYSKGVKGGQILHHRGYQYLKNRVQPDYIRWNCVRTHHPKCFGKVKTKNVGGQDVVYLVEKDHNHQPEN